MELSGHKCNLLKQIFDFIRADDHFPHILFFLALFSFGILIPFLGWYSDDWSYLWLAYRSSNILHFFTHNRPYLGYIYQTLATIIPAKPLAWQSLLFILKWSSAVFLWFMLKDIFPDQKNIAKWVCLLFLFYPGNLILFQPMVFIIVILQINSLLLSFFLSVKAAQSKGASYFYSIIAIVLALFNLISSEYFFFLELIRPLIFWFIQSRTMIKKARLKRTLLFWSPYLTIFIAVLIWRILFQSSLTHQQPWLLQDITVQPFQTLGELGRHMIGDMKQLFITAWGNPLLIKHIYQPQVLLTTLYFVLLSIFSGIFLWKCFKDSGRKNKHEEKTVIHTGKSIFVLGLTALLLGGLSIWLAKFEVSLVFDTRNRFTLPFILGASLTMVGLIFILIRSHTARNLLLCIILAFSIGCQFLIADLYRQEWNQMRNYYWQFFWRMPDLQTGLHFITNQPPLAMEGENALSAGLNWIYSHNWNKKLFDYYLYFDEHRIVRELGDLIPGKSIRCSHQIGDFSAQTLRVISFIYYPPHCLRVLEPNLVEENSVIPKFILNAQNISDLNTILSEPDLMHVNNIQNLFGKEPRHDWCYFFEKADLAKQHENWPEILQLYEEVRQLGLEPSNGMEWLSFIQALAYSGDLKQAAQLTRQAVVITRDNINEYCHIWENILGKIKTGEKDTVLIQNLYFSDLQCSLISYD